MLEIVEQVSGIEKLCNRFYVKLVLGNRQGASSGNPYSSSGKNKLNQSFFIANQKLNIKVVVVTHKFIIDMHINTIIVKEYSSFRIKDTHTHTKNRNLILY